MVKIYLVQLQSINIDKLTQAISVVIVNLFRLSLLMILLSCSGSTGVNDGILCFNFAPCGEPEIENFISISIDSLYDASKGYGWLNTHGRRMKGVWSNDSGARWESRGDLNIISRLGPDDLSRSFASGHGMFAVDLQPGKYEIWVLSGDWGLREYIPYESYDIVAEGVNVGDFQSNMEAFYNSYERAESEDDLTVNDVWRYHVGPRFQWIKSIVEVRDGQLNIQINGKELEAKISDFIGDYAISEFREGPPRRFSGALNAMIIGKADNSRCLDLYLRKAEDWRKNYFIKKWPLQNSLLKQRMEYKTEDIQRGYTVFLPNIVRPAMPYEKRPHESKTLKFRVTRGEYVPITFCICPLKDIGYTKALIEFPYFQSEEKDVAWQAKGVVASGVVKYVGMPNAPPSSSWQPQPRIIVPTDSWNIKAGITKQFCLQ